METNAQKIVRKNGYKATVKIFTDIRPFLERLDSMNEHKESLEEGIKFTPDEKYPDLTRNELIRQTILQFVDIKLGSKYFLTLTPV